MTHIYQKYGACPHLLQKYGACPHLLEIQTVPMREKITTEVQWFKKFQQMLLGTKTLVAVKDIDIRNYAKFILLEGSTDEKREFLRCLKSEIVLDRKKLYLK